MEKKEEDERVVCVFEAIKLAPKTSKAWEKRRYDILLAGFVRYAITHPITGRMTLSPRPSLPANGEKC